MKRVVFAFLALLFFLLSISVSAHSGRTDKNGGHYDRSTGEYHWHHGYPAHQHYDMDGDGDIDCPYNFVDKTNHASGSTKTPESSPGGQTTAEKRGWFEVISPFIIVAALIVILVLIWRLLKKRKELENLNAMMKAHETAMQKTVDEEKAKYSSFSRSLEVELKRKEDQVQQLQSDIENLKGQLLKSNGLTKQTFWEVFGEDIKDFVQIPDGDFIDEDGLPAHKDLSGTRWGRKYTRFITESTKKYHMEGCRYVGDSRQVHVFRVLKEKGVSPCKVCNPQFPDVQWFFAEKTMTKFVDSFFLDGELQEQEDEK